MISISHWLLFLSVTFVVSASPGPLMLLTMSNGINYGYTRSLAGMIGGSCGNLVLVSFTALGIGILLQFSETVFLSIKWIGVLFLAYLGIRQFFIVRNNDLMNESGVGGNRAMGIFSKAFFVSLTNPKGLIYFAALFPQFIVENDTIALQFFILTITFLATDFLWMSIYAIGGHVMASWLNESKGQNWLHRISGVMLLAAGILLAIP